MEIALIAFDSWDCERGGNVHWFAVHEFKVGVRMIAWQLTSPIRIMRPNAQNSRGSCPCM